MNRRKMLAEGDTAQCTVSRGPFTWFRKMALTDPDGFGAYGQHVHGAILIARCLRQDTFRFVGEK